MKKNHTHAHSHNTATAYAKHFAWAIGLNVVFVVVEIAYGLIANSSSLLADAGHNASDVLGLVFAWSAAWMATLRPRGRYTYGFTENDHFGFYTKCFVVVWRSSGHCMGCHREAKEPTTCSRCTSDDCSRNSILVNGFTALLFYKGQKNRLEYQRGLSSYGLQTPLYL